MNKGWKEEAAQKEIKSSSKKSKPAKEDGIDDLEIKVIYGNSLRKRGTVHVGSNAIAEIRSFSIETGDTVEDTSMGDSARSYKSTLTSFTSIDVFLDETDTSGQGFNGFEVTLNYPEGNASGDTYYSALVRCH